MAFKTKQSCKKAVAEYTRRCVNYSFPGSEHKAGGFDPMKTLKCRSLRRQIIDKKSVCKFKGKSLGFDATYIERGTRKDFPELARFLSF